jgi:hypothetical protein
MRYKPTNTVNGVVISRLQGEPNAELMLVTSDGKSQVLSLPLLMLAKVVEQGAMALARAATELPIPPRGTRHKQWMDELGIEPEPEPPVTRGDHEVMKDVCKILKDNDNGGEIDSRAIQRDQEYSDVANRTQAALDSVAWNRRVSPRLAVSKRTPSSDA